MESMRTLSEEEVALVSGADKWASTPEGQAPASFSSCVDIANSTATASFDAYAAVAHCIATKLVN